MFNRCTNFTGVCPHTQSKPVCKIVGYSRWLGRNTRSSVACCQSRNGSAAKVERDHVDSDSAQNAPAEWLEVAHSQGQALASQVSTLRESAEVGAAELENLQKQQDKDAAVAAELKKQLEEAEEEITVLRLQAERAAILEVQSEISSRLVEDLQELSEVRSENLDQAMTRLKEVEGALVNALDEVESESLQSTKILQAKDGEAARMKAMVAANKAEIGRMANELEGARQQLQAAARVADEAQVQRSAIQVEVTSLRNKYETLQRNYNTVKRARKKKAKGQALVDIDTAETEAKHLRERVDALEQDLRAAHAQLGDASRDHREALRDAENAKGDLERQIVALRAEAKERKEGSLKEVALLTMELDELRSADFEGQYEEKKEQVKSLEREIQIRDERVKSVEEQMAELRKALASKGEALDAAKSELSDLKNQVKEQLTELQLAREKLKAANKTIEEQKVELSTLRHDLDDANTELESKQTEVTELHGKVVSIRSHALKLEDELRAMNSGKSSNVQRVNELQQEVQIQKKNAVEAQQKLEQVQLDLEEVSLRERQLKETSTLLANELDKQRSNETTSASEIVDMRGQLSAMQQALQNKEDTLAEMREELQKGSQDMEQRDQEVSGLRSEIEKLKRRELGWATELQDAATVTSQLTERMEILESVLATKEEALNQAQGELQEKDSELSTVKSDREKLEKELQTMLQRDKEDKGTKSKGPGGMLHSALQQLQRELRRESMANEKLMVKAESLLKDGNKNLSGNSSSDEVTASQKAEDSAASSADESESEVEQQISEEEDGEQPAQDPPTMDVAGRGKSATPNIQELIKSLEKENSVMRSRMHGSMGDALNNGKSVGAYIDSGTNVLNRAGFGGDRVRRATQGSPRNGGNGEVRPFVKSPVR